MSLCGIKVEESLEKQTEEILKECDKLMDVLKEMNKKRDMNSQDEAVKRK